MSLGWFMFLSPKFKFKNNNIDKTQEYFIINQVFSYLLTYIVWFIKCKLSIYMVLIDTICLQYDWELLSQLYEGRNQSPKILRALPPLTNAEWTSWNCNQISSFLSHFLPVILYFTSKVRIERALIILWNTQPDLRI